MEFELLSVTDRTECYWKRLLNHGLKGRFENKKGLNGKDIPFYYIEVRTIKDLKKIYDIVYSELIVEFDDNPGITVYDGVID